MDIVTIIRTMGIMIIAALSVYYDLNTYKIPNRLIIIGIIMGIILSIYDDRILSIVNITMVYVIIFLIATYLLGALGAGDIKLYFTIGLFIGFDKLILVIAISFITGAIVGVIKLLYNHQLISSISDYVLHNINIFRTNIYSKYSTSITTEHKLHFSIFIFIALTICFLQEMI